MFPREYRLKNTKEIANVFKFGKYIHGKYVFIKYIPNNQKTAKIAISVSTKIFKQAVKRNRIKRQLREILRPYLLKLPTLDILVIVKKELTINTPNKKIATDISNIINKLILPKY
jgi:ribonuclease P protein component